jgi:multisubunit Na+/H+ antiporter MnhF subunit
VRLVAINTLLPLCCLLLEVVGILSPERALYTTTLVLSVLNVFFVGKYAKYLTGSKSKWKSKFIEHYFGSDD